jgi:hypothetical protein
MGGPCGSPIFFLNRFRIDDMKRFALGLLFFSILVLAVGYATALLPGGPPPFVPWLFAFATASSMSAILILGAARKGVRLGALKWVFGLCFLSVAGGFAVALVAPPVTPDSRLWLGLPAGAAAILFLVGLVPMLILPIAYALTFDRLTLGGDDLEDIRARLAAMRQESAE